jgi:ATP-dependent Clp protease adapter protein ClpS
VPETIEKEKVGNLTLTDLGVDLKSLNEKFMVRAYNNEVTPFDEVMQVFMRDCGYDRDTAFHYTHKIHKSQSSAIVFWDTKEKCEEIVQAFSKTALQPVFAEVLENE